MGDRLSWIEGLRTGDPQVMKALYDRHFPAVRNYVTKNSGSRRDAQDVFQEAITILWLNVKEGRVAAEEQNDLGGYLFRVAKFKWLDTLRSSEHRKMLLVMDKQGPVREQENVVEPGVDERLERLRALYTRLDGRCRRVLDMFYYEKQDLATIAAEMGVDEGSMRTIKYRCMMKLRNFKERIGANDVQEKEA